MSNTHLTHCDRPMSRSGERKLQNVKRTMNSKLLENSKNRPFAAVKDVRSIMDRVREICEAKPKTWRDEIEVIDYVPSLKPQNVIRDYWAQNIVNLRMCGENGRSQGMTSTAVTHAVAEHDINLTRVIRKKGDYLCGFKTTARRGFDSVTSVDSVNCPQCAKSVEKFELQPSIRVKDGFLS